MALVRGQRKRFAGQSQDWYLLGALTDHSCLTESHPSLPESHSRLPEIIYSLGEKGVDGVSGRVHKKARFSLGF